MRPHNGINPIKLLNSLNKILLPALLGFMLIFSPNLVHANLDTDEIEVR